MHSLTVGALLDAAVERDPTAPALVDQERRLTYAELQDEVDRAVRALRDARVRRGTTVAASAANGIDMLVAFLATMRRGARWVGISRALTSSERGFLLNHCRARVFLTDGTDPAGAAARIGTVFTLGADGSWQDAVRNAAASRPTAEPDPLAPAAIAYTSGTTGRPKGVVHSQRNLTLPGRYLATTADFDDSSVVGVALPFTTLNVIIVSALPALFAGRPCIAVPKLEASTIARWIARERITNMSIPPPVLYDLATRDDIGPDALATLRSPRTGGAEFPDTTRAMFAARFDLDVVGTYGLTEAPAVVTVESRDEPHVPGASGKVVPYLDVRIVDDRGEPVPTGEIGEIAVTASTAGDWRGVWRPMLGYWRRPAATRAAIRDGMLLTGDIGYLDADGNLYVVDRKGNLVNRGGANVYPAEIERILRQVPGVAHGAVVGLPDARLGERVAVAIEVEPGVTLSPETILDHCRAHLARYKVPEVVVFVSSLPRNSMGKVILPEVREQISAAMSTVEPR
jgi:long-chain acyl-CoA synthetase